MTTPSSPPGPPALSRAIFQFGRVLHCEAATGKMVVAAVSGAYSVFEFAPEDAQWLAPSTHVHGPLNMVGPITLSIVGVNVQARVEGISGQVPKAEAYEKFFTPTLLV